MIVNKHCINKISVVCLVVLLSGKISWGQTDQSSLSKLAPNLNSETNKKEANDKLGKLENKKKEISKSIELQSKSYFLNPDYMFPDKRDPFVPLLMNALMPGGGDGNEANLKNKKGKETQKGTFKRFGNELKKLKSIPYEFFKTIKNLDPGLYANLEKYGKLFREKSYLRKLGKGKYFGTVNRYRDLINLANKMAKESPKTPLQTPIKKLKLVGGIWGDDNKMALVETTNSKGHSVKMGRLIGESFGVIQSIESDKIIIEKKLRNFDGNVSSKIDEIRLKQNS
jgi:Tfp pilus assembly protein PilP